MAMQFFPMAAQLQLGVDARTFALGQQESLKNVLMPIKPHMVKVLGWTATGAPAGEFTGFMYNSSVPIIITAGHGVGWTGQPGQQSSQQQDPAARFFVQYFDGIEEEVQVVAHAANNLPDIALLRGSRCAPSNLKSYPASQGNLVCTIGFSGGQTEPLFAQGNVMGVRAGAVYISGRGLLGGARPRH